MSQDIAQNDSYEEAFERELKELESSPEKLSACLSEKKEMEHFLSKSTLSMIRELRGEHAVAIQGEIRQVAILFSDIRGFTSFSELLGTEKVFSILNAYLSAQSENIARNQGVIDKFLGDGMMAIFEGENRELNALCAAIDMQKSVEKLNYKYTKRAVLNVGIGIHSGHVFMGVLGETGRQDYTAIGDNVNIASRLCSMAAAGEILLSEQVKEALPAGEAVQRRDMVRLKGKREPLPVYHYQLDIGYPEIQRGRGKVHRAVETADTESRASTCDSARGVALSAMEKELIAVAASIVSGCQHCADYHFVQVLEEGASEEKVRAVVRDAAEMISYAGAVMHHKACSLMGEEGRKPEDLGDREIDRISLLARLGAAIALNNTTAIADYVKLALARGLSNAEIKMTAGIARVVVAKAKQFADKEVLQALGIVSSDSKVSMFDCHLK